MPLFQGLIHGVVEAAVHVHHLLIVSQGGLCVALEKGDNVAQIFHLKAHALQALAQPGIADGGGAHADAPFGCTKVHLHTNKIDDTLHR